MHRPTKTTLGTPVTKFTANVGGLRYRHTERRDCSLSGVRRGGVVILWCNTYETSHEHLSRYGLATALALVSDGHNITLAIQFIAIAVIGNLRSALCHHYLRSWVSIACGLAMFSHIQSSKLIAKLNVIIDRGREANRISELNRSMFVFDHNFPIPSKTDIL